jgi:hypothetical protein
MHQHTQEQFLKLVHYKPIQVKIDKNSSHISKVFYPEFDAIYELVFVRSSVEENDNKIVAPSIKIQIIRSNQKIDVYKYGGSQCDIPICYLGSFHGVAKQKHTIVVDASIVNPKLYSLNPVIDSRISSMYAVSIY